jgi:hypothetical protein
MMMGPVMAVAVLTVLALVEAGAPPATAVAREVLAAMVARVLAVLLLLVLLAAWVATATPEIPGG